MSLKITFNTKRLEKLANNDREANAVLGKIRAKKFRQRLNDMLDADTLEDIRFLPGNYHELTGDRKGTWACDLDQPYRLIFKPHEDPVPADSSGRHIWSKITGVEILEIIDYH